MNFVKRLLAPHLGARGIDIHAPVVTTRFNRRLGVKYKGGGSNFALWKRDLGNLWKQHGGRPQTHLTTFIDLYALPSDFPGYNNAVTQLPFRYRADKLQEALKVWAESQGFKRFIPYLAVHEFETMVFTDVQALRTLFLEYDGPINNLANEVGAFLDVEGINSTPDGAPSKRIAKHIPVYAKYKRSEQSGIINVLEMIELHAIRRACNNVDVWVRAMESL